MGSNQPYPAKYVVDSTINLQLPPKQQSMKKTLQ